MLLEMQIKSTSYFPTSDLWNKYSGKTTSLEMDICFSSFPVFYWNIFALHNKHPLPTTQEKTL